MDAKSWMRSPKGRNVEATTSVSYSCWQLVSPLKRLLVGNALVSQMGFLLARQLLDASWAVVHLLGTGV
ncbi:hypothetical protein CRG98_032394 [Punica granatum]|uniref:Uncharacterized protein n=1 Tax=Punica granatum TaxID=22663 RepID=A0A2I0IT82_PUNGR|nr:hypothetical protein CRG98_032394 [Punica granatum]